MKGFTLLEVMVALAIMAGVVLTVISSVNYHLALATRDREETIALLLARSKVEELEMPDSRDAERKTEGTFAPEWPGYSWKTERAATSVPGFRQLTVTVSWGAERRSVSLEKYQAQKQ
ncbi:MAG: type II secretion system minor pseudopilin GspI [Geobacteraceae bacterium]|nr:type II secretion system minor pseudopilin GspI [Geobacteraceae bacterium]